MGSEDSAKFIPRRWRDGYSAQKPRRSFRADSATIIPRGGCGKVLVVACRCCAVAVLVFLGFGLALVCFGCCGECVAIMVFGVGVGAGVGWVGFVMFGCLVGFVPVVV